jgi:uncharacterized protein YbjQ (UPF0145 family)
MKRMSTFAALVVAAAVSSASPAIAKDKQEKTYVVVNDAVGVPVFPYDITDRPYAVIGEVKAGVRKATIFSKEASQEKIYRELWERGEKMGADAIINAKYGDSHVSAFSWGKTNATGTAIKFVAAAPDATAAAEPAVEVQAEPAADAGAVAEAAPAAPAAEPAVQVQAAPAADATGTAEATAEAADTTSVEVSSEASVETPVEQVDSASGVSVEAAPAEAPATDAEAEPTEPAVTPN